VAADVVGFSTKQLIEATRRGDFSVAREWLVVGEVFRELSKGRTPSEEFIKLADSA
jgi:ribosome maturation protein Sdo1